MDAIYDRNILDVQIAKEYRTKILTNGFNGLSDEEKTIWLAGLKGCFNYTDWNRIETNCATLSDIFNLGLVTKTNWTIGDMPVRSDYERLLTNVQSIRSTRYVYSSTPSVPVLPLNNYSKINNIEQILFDVYTCYNANMASLDYMGELYDTTYELYDEADYTYFNNLRHLYQMGDDLYCDEEIGVI